MTDEQYNEIIVLEKKVDMLIDAYEKISNENTNMKLEIHKFKQEIKQKDNEINNIYTKYNNLKIAKSLQETLGDTKETKAKLNLMVREIEKCIKLLNI